MTGAALLAVVLAGTGAAMAGRARAAPHPRVRPPGADSAAEATQDSRATGPPLERALLARLRVPLALLAGFGAWAFLGGLPGLGAGGVAAAAAWRVLSSIESPAVARRRDRVRADLPVAVELLAAALEAGGAPVTAFGVVADALPGPLGEELATVHHRLQLGVDPRLVWADLAREENLAPLGRALGRAHDSGAAVTATVLALATDLRDRARAQVEERARSVDVRAAAPLGVCLLPAFLLLGVVPMVAGLFTAMDLFG